MNNTARLLLGLVLAGSLAALATPELAAHLNVVPGLTTILAAGLGEMLRRLNAPQASESEEKQCEQHEPPSSPEQ